MFYQTVAFTQNLMYSAIAEYIKLLRGTDTIQCTTIKQE